ncbi:hypothetical protein G6F62_001031 [Rhizopus arrhizus]|nr:hypothetical protein G6F66_004671 [Rhizopus arrhizus]KAG1358071.1 hypothetical protein G6F62_001031 [Rhizopus arrhizus]KAG1379828.1 hypothetical protein G6F61_004594 [Rhizopus arrhizus]KAG1406728.1 hypothetical protein G6F60_002705 [Rhizopus arrhizus]
MAITRKSQKRNGEQQNNLNSKRSRKRVVKKTSADEDQMFESIGSSRSLKRVDQHSEDLGQKKKAKGKQKEDVNLIDKSENKSLQIHDAQQMDTVDMEVDEEEEEEDEIDWETVELPHMITDQVNDNHSEDNNPVYKDVEIVFEAPRAVLKKSKWEIEYQRNLREWTHNSHIITLIAHYAIRNRWCSSDKAKFQCLKIVPEHARKLLSNNTTESSIITGIKWILNWWKNYFSITGPGLVTRPYSDFEDISHSFLQDMIAKRESNENAEWVDNLDEFVNLLLKKEGTSDLCSELFVSILRSCNCDARLVCSLQPVPYKIPPNSKKQNTDESTEQEETQESLLFQFRTPTRTHVDQNVQLRQTNAKPPCVWIEVYCPESKRWICVDPIRGIIDKPALMEPAVLNRSNQLSFVLAFDEKKKHYITDVTRRYTSNMDKANRLRDRPLTKREQSAGMRPWSEILLSMLCHKPKMNEKERLEMQDLEKQEKKERMPTSIGAFKNHPIYALERHLKKFEVLHPREPILGSIRGEKIYPRQCVKVVSTADAFRKQGREIIKGEQPIKMVKSTATTIEKKRIHEMAKQEGQEVLVPCYGEWQTQKIIPDPVVDGKVPKNSFGNIDLFVPEMLPAGAVHIPIRGIGKLAKRLGVDYADAVTGFEFVKMRSVPIIEGIVVAKEFQFVLMEALEEQEKDEAVRAIEKQEKEVYLRWRKLIKGLLVKARVDNEYGTSKSTDNDSDMWTTFNMDDTHGGGGFLPEDD